MSRKRITPWVLAVSQSVLVFTAGAVVATIVQDAMDRYILSSESLTLLLIFASLTILAFMISLLIRYVEDIRHRMGVKTTYVELEPGHEGQANLFVAATNVVKSAQRAIYAAESDLVESWVDDDNSLATPITNQARDNYYSALLDRAVHGNVVYERIFQLEEGQDVTQHAIGSSKLRHYRQMVEERDQHQNRRVGLFKAPVQRLLTFVLVDDVYLMWQINEMLPGRKRRMNGILIIEDQRGEIVGYFKTFFQGLRRSSTGNVQITELPPTSTE